MKKRILSSFLSLVLVLSLMPVSALAAEGPQNVAPAVVTEEPGEVHGEPPVEEAAGPEEPACICESLCTGETVNTDCPICTADYTACTYEAPADEQQEPAGEQGEPVGPTAEEQLTALIAALPDPADIDPEDEEQVERISDQISEIYAYAEEHGLDVENDETINSVIGLLYPADNIANNGIWDDETTLSENLVVNQGETLTIGAKVTISGNVTISGGGTIKRDQSYQGELISVPAGAELTLKDITIDGGATWTGEVAVGLAADEAAIRIEGGQVTLDNGAVVQNNNHTSTQDNAYDHTTYEESGQTYDLPRYYNMGGGIAVYGGTLTMNEGSSVKNNAVTNTNYSKVTSGTNRTGNSDSLGGGVAVYENGTFIMNGGEISQNVAAVSGGEGRAFGGGVGLMTRGANAQVSDTPDDYYIGFYMYGGTICDNGAANGGGGIYGGVDQGDDESQRHTHLDMTVASAVCENTSSAGGGGIQVGSGDLKIENGADISSNTAVSGGGIQVGSASHFTMSGGSVSYNEAVIGEKNLLGGGIYFSNGSNNQLSITGGEIKNNCSKDSGGGIQITTGLTVSIANCTIQGNSCGAQGSGTVANGGGIQANPGVVLNLLDCVITDNKSITGHGGGVHISGPNKNAGGTATISGTTTIQDNQSSLAGANMYVATVTSTTDLSNLSQSSQIGLTWNVNDVDVNNGTVVASGVTEDNYSCIKYEPAENADYVLRRAGNTAVLHKALSLTLRSISPDTNQPINDIRYTVLGLVGETVDFTEVCGFELTGYHIDRWATNYVGQEGYLWENPYTFSDSFSSDAARGGPNAIWAPNEYKIIYELNGGVAGVNAPDKHTYGTVTDLVAPTREGCVFGGWFADSSFTGPKITSLGAEDYTSDIMLYALWTKEIGEDSSYSVDVIQDQTYTGTAIEPAVVVRNSTTGDVIADSQYRVSYSSNINVGEAKVTVTIGNDSAEVTFQITRDNAPTVAMSDVSVTYGTAYAMTVAAKTSAGNAITDGTITIRYYTDEDCSKDESETAPTAAGIYYAKATLAETDNYGSASASAKITIRNADFSVTAQGYDGTYDGQPHSITVTAEGAAVTYSTTENGTYSETNPTFTDAGEYTVYYRAAKANHNDVTGNVTVKIAKAVPAITISSDKAELRGGGTVELTVEAAPADSTVTVTQTDDQGSEARILTLTDGTVSVKLDNRDARYTFTASCAETNNYTAGSSECTVTVSRRSAGGGGGSSSSTTAETTTNRDGSKTTTVTDKKTGTVTETTKFQDGSILVVETQKDGTVTTTETTKNGVKIKTVDEPGEDVTAEITVPKSVGEAVVIIPADVDCGTVAVDTDTGEVVKLSVPTKEGMTVKLADSAELVLVDRSRNFDDTRNHWAKDAINFATAHELFSGTSDTAFTPDSPMTRAMLMTVLARFDGQDTTGGAVWYEKAMEWARENGISDGSDPDGSITREQLATMLWRYAGSPAGGGSLSSFGDSASVSAYALEAVRWAAGEGLISGTDAGLLAPQGSATRAQVATILMRFVESLTK